MHDSRTELRKGSTVAFVSDLSIGDKDYPVEIYTTNAGKELRGVWMGSKAEALKYGPSTFEKRGKGFFVRERDFPQGSTVAKPDANEGAVFSTRASAVTCLQ